MLKKFLIIFLFLSLCPAVNASKFEKMTPLDLSTILSNPTLTFIHGLKGFQQTTEYTCGPAALLSVAHYYNPTKFPLTKEMEMAIALEAGTSNTTGTDPEGMMKWLKNNGFESSVLSFEEKGDYSSLLKLHENLKKGIPGIIEWIDWGGHWVVAVGYLTMGTQKVDDDIIIFADPWDRIDGFKDGYTAFNADRFYWMWFDALCFGQLTWRTMITVPQ